PESEVSAPHLGEVVKELDCDTKHVGNPTRSPRNRCPWKNDPYHFPSYARKCITADERKALVEACADLDPGRTGQIPVEHIEAVFNAVNEKGMTARAMRSLPRQSTGTGMVCHEFVTFRSLIDFLYESICNDRQPFGGKRCIVNRLPLPPCCTNGYCTAHLDKPSLSDISGGTDDDLAKAALEIVFARHDADGSGIECG
ncbi:unnamed protein product, partial [Sphacelaria rigidula]